MNRMNLNSVLKCERRRMGQSEKGDWEMLVTKDERGSCEIAVFVNNRPSGVEEGGNFRLVNITGVSYGNKKDSNGNWRANVSISAKVEPIFGIDEYLENHPEEKGRAAEQGAVNQWEELENDGELPF